MVRGRNLRSRHGCHSCRKRHRKCDEERPFCRGCQLRGIACEYPTINIRWSAPNHGVRFPEERSHRVPYASPNHEISLPSAQPEASPGNSSEGPSEASSRDTFEAPSFPLLDGNEDTSSADHLAFRSFHDDALSSGGITGVGCGQHDVDVSGTLVASLSKANTTEFDIFGLQLWALGDMVASTEASEDGTGAGETMAFTYYIQNICGLLAAHDATDNPYRRLVSLALGAPVLLHTMLSVATAYMYKQGALSTIDLTVMRQERALTSLRTSVAKILENVCGTPGAEVEAALAAILLQIFHSAITGSIDMDIHFSSAFFLMKESGSLRSSETSYFTRILAHRFAVIDIARAIYRRTRPLAGADFWLYRGTAQEDTTKPLFSSMSGYPVAVLSFLVRIANLSCDIVDRLDSFQAVREAMTLESEMNVWFVREAEHLDDLGCCFYWMSQLLLHRRVFREGTRSVRIQIIIRNIFRLIDNMPIGSGPDSSVFLPFNIAAREAVDESDRVWVRDRCKSLYAVYPVDASRYCMDSTEAVWQRLDQGGVTIEEDLLRCEMQHLCFAF